jgi:UDP-glucose 4-epimerase
MDEAVYRNFQKVLEFRIGDVRNYNDVCSAVKDADIVVNAAALKQVPSCEYFPYQGILTNCVGAQNIVQSILEHNFPVETVIGISTDKAAKPVNAMGMTKALMEKLVKSTKYSYSAIPIITRYGNVIGSRGSVIPYFIESIKNFGLVKVTNPQMTRFMMSLDESVELVLFAFANGKSGDLFVQKSPAANVITIVKALEILMSSKEIQIDEIGVRPGEKMHETLLTIEERNSCIESDLYFQVKRIDLESNNQNLQKPELVDYSSDNTTLLSSSELATLLNNNSQIKKLLL